MHVQINIVWCKYYIPIQIEIFNITENFQEQEMLQIKDSRDKVDS